MSVRFCREAGDLPLADVVVLPGSKQTVDDLLWMRATGMEAAILEHARRGLVAGVCGGMQMLGMRIEDPDGMEHAGAVEGMGLLPIRTSMRRDKVTTGAAGAVSARAVFGAEMAGVAVRGYEIHLGETVYDGGAQSFAELARAPGTGAMHRDGCVSRDSRVFGTYLHGVFDADGFRAAFIGAARERCGLLPAAAGFSTWTEQRERSLNRLAEEVRGALDMERILGWLGLPCPGLRGEAADARRAGA